MEKTLQEAAQNFCAVLKDDDTVRAFYEARDAYDRDEDIYQMRMDYTQLVHDLRNRQTQGTLTEQDLEGLRTLEQKIHNHEYTQALSGAQSNLAGLLEHCNMEISEAVGFDYASSAAPPKSCGC